MPKSNKQAYFALKYPGPDDMPGKTYYYRRHDGSIFACGPKEAAAIHTKYQQVGVSDGQTYLRVVRDAVDIQDADLEACEEERERGLDEAVTKEEKIGVLRWYRTERLRISNDAKAALKRAREEDLREAMKRKELPAPTNGQVVGDTNPKINMMIQNMIGKL